MILLELDLRVDHTALIHVLQSVTSVIVPDKPLPFVKTASQEALATFSPDGRYVAYQSDETGKWEIVAVTAVAPFVSIAFCTLDWLTGLSLCSLLSPIFTTHKQAWRDRSILSVERR